MVGAALRADVQEGYTMYKWFRKQGFVVQVIVVMVTLFVAWTAMQLVLGLIKALLPLAILAVLIVGVLWLYDKANSD